MLGNEAMGTSAHAPPLCLEEAFLHLDCRVAQRACSGQTDVRGWVDVTKGLETTCILVLAL